MKKITFFISLFFMLTSGYVRGQCLENPDFAEGCLQTIDPYCPTFHNACIPNWGRSHGSPQLFINGTPGPNNLMYMWASKDLWDAEQGEGVFAGYNFVSGKMYNITLRADAAGPNNGGMKIFATSGLTNGLVTCGNTPPTLSSFQEIPVTILVNQGMQTYSINFTADNNYTQLLMYPVGVRFQSQMNLAVDYINVCPAECGPPITYNSGLVPTGETRATVINAGSSAGTGGSGTVGVSGIANTSLVASTEINLLPQFEAIIAGNGEFSASLVTCSGGAARSRFGPTQPSPNQDFDLRKFLEKQDSAARAKILQPQSFLLYPSPARDMFTVELLIDPSDPVELKLLTSTGTVIRTIKRTSMSAGEIQRVQIPLTGLTRGIYFVQVISKKGSKVRKIEKIE